LPNSECIEVDSRDDEFLGGQDRRSQFGKVAGYQSEENPTIFSNCVLFWSVFQIRLGYSLLSATDTEQRPWLWPAAIEPLNRRFDALRASLRSFFETRFGRVPGISHNLAITNAVFCLLSHPA
jgi:hypothetical protein